MRLILVRRHTIGQLLARASRVGLVVLLAGLLAFSASTAQALTLNLAPNPVVSSANWSPASAAIPAAIATNDGDTTYASTTQTDALRVELANPAVTGVISKVTLRVVARSVKSMGSGSTTVSLQYGLAVGSGTPDLASSSVTENGGSYQTLTHEMSTRPGGGSWTWDDVTNVQAVVQATGFAINTSLRVTQIEVVVDYTPTTPNTIAFSAHTQGQPAAANVLPSAEVVVNRFSLRRTVGDTAGPVVNTITINNSKSSPSSNVSGVFIYKDNDNDGVVSPGDTKLNGTAATFSVANATVTVNELVTDSAVQYLVTYVVKSSAADGQTMDAKITAAATTNVQTVTGLPIPATTPTVFTVRRPLLTVGNSDHVPSAYTYAKSLAANVAVDNLRLAASYGDVTVNKITVHRPDTLTAGSVALVKLYLDDQDGTFEASEDTLLGQVAFGVGANAVFSGLGVSVLAGDHADVWIVYDVAGICEHDERLGSQIEFGGLAVNSPAAITSFSTLTSVMSGEGVIIDNVAPDPVVCVITQPASGASISASEGSSYQITGTAADALSGVAWVKVSVKRLTEPAAWWAFGLGTWSSSEAWTDADNTGVRYSTWDPEFTIPESDGTSFEVSALFGDLAGNETMSTSVLLIDNVKPTVQSVVPQSATTVDVIFSESLDSSVLNSADFTIAGLAVSGAEWLDLRTVQLTTDAQVADTLYTLTVAADAVADLIGNANAADAGDFYGWGSTIDTIPPSIPTGVSVTAGASEPTIAVISWTASTGDPDGYQVLRAVNPAGPFTPVGTTDTESFNDIVGVPGQNYYYAIKSFDAAGNYSAQSDTAGPVSAEWIPGPHGTYTNSTALCKMCHSVHQAVDVGKLMRQTGSTPGELSVCYTCHDGALAGNIESGETNSFSTDLVSGHSVEEVATSADLTNVCSDCHSPHQDPDTHLSLPAQDVNGVPITEAGNDWCLACHNATYDWYAAGGYDALLVAPSRNATGYPTVGTFPGYLSDANNPHAAVTTSTPSYPTGDCLYCHASHRASNEFDGLVSTFTATDFTLCFDCHDGTTTGYNIKQYYPTTAGGGATQTAGTRFGHKIESDTGNLPAGSALPCYDCHNPHGSTVPNGLLVITETSADTTIAVGDGASELDPSDATGIREFCFTCHTTCGSSSPGDSVAYGWNGGGYAAVTAGAKFEGIDRTVRGAGVGLKLPVLSGHYRDDTASCLTCHGTLTAASSVNVHNPGSGVSAGGQACYLCHAYNAMEQGNAAAGDSYHHVLGDTYAGDYAGDFDAVTPGRQYPAAGTNVYCLSCHVDHDVFNSGLASNLRPDGATVTSPTGTATDFNTTSKQGVCTGCHSVVLNKDTNSANQKQDGTTKTPAIGTIAYAASAHGIKTDATAYAVGGTFTTDSSVFSANCSKCHNDSMAKSYQNPTYKFGTHLDPTRRILAALGRTGITDPYAEEGVCYRCHSLTTDGLSGAKKSTNNLDWYGVAPMDLPSQRVYQQITSLSYKHDMTLSNSAHKPSMTDEVSGNRFTAAQHVECADCHSPHAAGNVNHVEGAAAGNAIGTLSPLQGVWGVSITGTGEWREPTYTTQVTPTAEYQICLKCHSGFNSSYTPDVAGLTSGTFSWSRAAAANWTNVALEFNPQNDSYHPVFGTPTRAVLAARMKSPWNVVGRVGNQTMYCSDCHMDSSASPAAMGPHGSSTSHLLRGPWSPTTSTLSNQPTGFLCAKCHTLTGTNTAHQNVNHTGQPCAKCHITIPHGGAAPRLLATTGGLGTPARYTGVSSGVSLGIVNFDLPASGMGRTMSDCQTTGTCSSHSSSVQPYTWSW